MGAVELPVAAEPSGTKFHRPLRRHLRQHFLSTHRRGLLFSRRRPARLRRRETFLPAFACADTSALDCPVPPFRRACLLQLQTRYFFEWKKLNIQGRADRLAISLAKTLARRDGRRRLDDSSRRNLSQRAHSDDRIAPNPSCPRNGRWHSATSVVRFRQWRLRREMRRADIRGQLAISERELAKQRRVIEKQLKKRAHRFPSER